MIGLGEVDLQVGKALPAKGGKVKLSGGWAETKTVDIEFGK